MPEELPNSLTEHQLLFGGWFIRHKIGLAENGKRVLFILTLGLLFYSGYGLLDGAFMRGATERARTTALVGGLIDRSNFEARNSPQSLIFGESKVFPGVAGKLDFASETTNPNRRWLAKINYVFTVDGVDTRARSTILLPLQTKILSFFGYEGNAGVSLPALKIISLDWARIPPHQISDPESWMAERLALTVEDITTTIVPVGSKRLLKTSFVLANNGAYGYWQFPLDISLRRGGEIIAIQEVTLTSVVARERRLVDLYWFQDVSGNVAVEVKPAVNVFDSAVYLR